MNQTHDKVCGDAADAKWWLPMHYLNLLWAHVYPRIAANVWRHANMGPSRPAKPTVGADMIPWLLVEIDHIKTQGPVPPTPSWLRFEERADALKCYLKDYPDHCPVTYGGKWAYDYLLSDQGILLFEPPYDDETVRPGPGTTEGWFYSLYSHRRTGRSAIGVPKIGAATHVVSPTGPGMLEVSEALLNWVSNPACVPQDRDPRHMSIDEFVCALDRCWILKGSVISAVSNEFPRIVARRWLEEESLAKLTDYGPRYTDDGDHGLRSIFAERLEVSLPQALFMKWEASASMANAPAPWPAAARIPGGKTIEWTGGSELVFTQQGVFFPEANPRPGKLEILEDIVQGRAGNPVFTDTGSCG